MANGHKRLLKAVITILVSLNLVLSPTFFDRAYGSATSGLEKSKLAPPLTLGKQANGKTAELARLVSGSRIRTELTVPEGQPEGFFTNDIHGYRIDELFAKPVEQIPDVVVKAITKKLDEYIAERKLLGAVVKDFGATDIDIHVTHRYGEVNAAVQRLILDAMKEGVLKAQELGLLKEGIDINSMSLADLAKALRVKYQAHSITERGSEPVVMAKIVGAGIGAANIKLYHEFFMPGSTPLQKLGFVPKGKKGVRGFRAIVRKTEDVLKGNFDGPVWEFEVSSAFEDAEGKKYPSKDESRELLALASQPNDFQIMAIYTVEGSTITSTEPIVSVVYQPAYGEEGNLRTLNPTFICRSQSGADAVGGVASMFYDVNFVPGGPNGERYVVTRPVTLKEARKAPKEGTAHVVIYGWQSELNGVIPREKGEVIDHVAINPPALGPERELADFLAKVMTTHQHDQPYIAPFAAQAQVDPLRKVQSHLFSRAPKEADIDSFMDEVEAKVDSGELLSVTDDKADMGGMFGHNFTPQYMLAIDLATVLEAKEKGSLTDGNIIGAKDQERLRRGITMSIGDDSHLLMLGDKSRNSAQSHQLSFLAFTRGYLASMVGNTNEFDPTKKFEKPKKPYGRGQDFAGKEAKAAMANPYFYSQISERFFEILREVMPQDYMQMVNNMEKGWRHWQNTKQETALSDPFSGNVSQQGIGSARYLVDIAGGEREFGILAGDKMGPAALNRPIREGVYVALAAGEFENGLVFEIWDAKAFDEHGNIPIEELPELFADVADAITSLKEAEHIAFVKGSYKDGVLRSDLSVAEKERTAELLKKAGYVPSKRIFLDAQADKDAVYLYLADSDRFNIKQVWAKKNAGWDIENPQDYLDRPILGSSVTKLGILAGGEYIGKDDPVMVGNMKLMQHIYEFLRTNPLIIQGDMNGSHWLAAIPTAAKYAVASKESHPILVGLRYTLSDDGKALAKVDDIFGSRDFSSIRRRMFKFDFEFKRAQLGGQFEPYGTNWLTVEASYPLAKLLRALQAPDSSFLVKNKSADERTTRPTGIVTETAQLFEVVAALPESATTRLVRGEGTPVRLFRDILSNPELEVFTIAKLISLSKKIISERTVRREVEALLDFGLIRVNKLARSNQPALYQMDEAIMAIIPEQRKEITSIPLLDKPSLTEEENKGLKEEISALLAKFTGDTNLAYRYADMQDTIKTGSNRVIILQPHMIAESIGFRIYLENLIANAQGRITVIIDGSQIQPDKVDEFLALTGLDREGKGYKVVTDAKDIEALRSTALTTVESQSDNDIVVVGTDVYLTNWQQYSNIRKLQVNELKTSEEANLGILPAAVSIALGIPASEILEQVPNTNTYILMPGSVSAIYSQQLAGYKAQLGAK